VESQTNFYEDPQWIGFVDYGFSPYAPYHYVQHVLLSCTQYTLGTCSTLVTAPIETAKALFLVAEITIRTNCKSTTQYTA
jgi:hypothetical protein